LNPNNYCTYFNISFAVYGLALLESIFRHDPTAQVYVLCLDVETFELLSKNENEQRYLVSLQSLEGNFASLGEAKRNRSTTEYFWTLTPCLLHYLIFNKKVCKTLTYLDADQLFFSDPKPIFEEINDADISIMPHRFPEELDSLKAHGNFNVSWLTFKNNSNAKSCLQWWMNSCIEWCYAKVEGEKYGDQKYLDQFPLKFKKVHQIENKGCGLAPWNLSTFDYGQKVILFHFQSFRIQSSCLFTAVIQLTEKCDLSLFKEVILKQYFFFLKKNFNKANFSPTHNSSDKSSLYSENSVMILYIFKQVFFIRNKILKSLLIS
jgi:hypothetical protein